MKVERKCRRCGCAFMARDADVRRGWAKFCSKSCAEKARMSAAIREAKHRAPWQRYDLCTSDDDRRDLLRNPRIIEPLYDDDGERSGEVFFAGGEFDQ
jgi:hypothetical protein